MSPPPVRPTPAQRPGRNPGASASASAMAPAPTPSQGGFLGRGFLRFGFRKNVDQLLAEAADKQGLAKTLSAFNLIVLGVAGIIGGGIFVLVGNGIVTAGALVVPAFVLAAIICVVAGLAYAELASAIPASGSAYAYIYTAMGELPGWMVAWALILEYAVGAIAVAVSCRNNILAVVKQVTWLFNPADATAQKNYFQDPGNPALYGWTHSPLEAVNVGSQTSPIWLHGYINVPSIILVFLITALLVKGTKESARFTAVLVVTKIAILLFTIGVAFMYFDSANFKDPVPHPTAALPDLPDVRQLGGAVTAIFGAAAIMFFAYIGFDSVSTTAEETKNPKRDLPIGILGSLGISTLLYILAAGALVGASNWSMFVGNSGPAVAARGEPFGYVFEQKGALELTLSNGAPFGLGALLVRLGAMIGTTSVLLVLILGGVRVFFNMSRDGLLPGWMSTVSPRGNPAKTTWLYGIFTLIFAGLLTLDAAVELVNIGTLFAFFMVVLAVWTFRRRRPDVERPFRMPLWNMPKAVSWVFVAFVAIAGTVGLVFAGGSLLFVILAGLALAVVVAALAMAVMKTGSLPLFAILGLAGIAGLIFSLDPFTLVASATWAGIGLLVYALYGIRHSKEAHHRHVAAQSERPDPFLVGRPAGTTQQDDL